MRLLLTADWHLGRLLHGVHLTDDQAHLLDQIVDLAADEHPDAIVVAGDVFDRAVPPPDAVSLLSDVMGRVALDLRIPLIIVAGNHDSPRRLAFGASVLAREGVHLAGRVTASPSAVTLADDHGPVRIHALPYAEPAVVREVLGRDDLRDHDAALGALLDAVRAGQPPGERCVVVAHAFVAGGRVSESERPLTVGGAGTVDAGRFQGIDLVALGHLHRPQTVGGHHIRYAGSPMAYSFDEAGGARGVDLVDLAPDGSVTARRVPLAPRHDLRCVEGLLDDLLRHPDPDHPRDDYLLVRLQDRGPLLEVMSRLREVYPNVLHVERPVLVPAEDDGTAGRHRLALTDVDLFDAFARQVAGQALAEDERQALAAIVDAVDLADREAAP